MNKLLIENTTREERENYVENVLYMRTSDGSPRIRFIEFLYQFYIDGKLELTDIDEIVDLALDTYLLKKG